MIADMSAQKTKKTLKSTRMLKRTPQRLTKEVSAQGATRNGVDNALLVRTVCGPGFLEPAERGGNVAMTPCTGSRPEEALKRFAIGAGNNHLVHELCVADKVRRRQLFPKAH